MKKNGIPQIESIFIELTNYCNFHCKFCPSDVLKREKKFLDKSLVFSILDQINELGLEGNLLFHAMGEPFLHKDFIEILKYNPTNLLPEIVTNGFLIDELILNELTKVKYKSILLSWQTPTKESFELYRTEYVKYEDYLEKLKLLFEFLLYGKLKRPVEIDFLYTGFSKIKEFKIINSLKEANAVIAFLRKFIISIKRDIDFIDINLTYDKIIRGSLLELVKGKVYVRFRPIHSFSDFLRNKNKVKKMKKYTICALPFYQLVILSNGDVVICCMDYDGEIVLGNIFEKSIKEIWLGEKATKIRESFFRGIPPQKCCRCQELSRFNNLSDFNKLFYRTLDFFRK